MVRHRLSSFAVVASFMDRWFVIMAALPKKVRASFEIGNVIKAAEGKPII